MKKSKLILSISLVFVILFSLSSCMISDFWPTDFTETNFIYEADSEKRYFYKQLSPNAKIAYTLILNDLKNHNENIEVPEITNEEFNAVFHAVSYDNPEMMCLGLTSELKSEGNKYYFSPSYSHQKSECEKISFELEDAVNKIISKMPEGLSDFDKEVYIHDSVCNICEYDHSAEGINKNKAYDALVKGLAVCEGYARATQLLLNRVNINNYLIVGNGTNNEGNTQSHMWNIVQIDGKNYHLDTTWDDLGKEHSPLVSYTYFNITDKAISSTHFDFEPKENNCVSSDNNYFVVNNLYYKSVNEINDNNIVSKIASSKAQNSFQMAFSDKNVYDKAKNQLIDNGYIYDIVDKTNSKLNKKKFNNVLYILDEKMLVINFVFE